jgi:inosine-uridine nucleoside N-ribohydrolase
VTIRVVLDCDPGTDDAGAIMLAVPYPALGLSAVTTVNGNVPFGSGPRA